MASILSPSKTKQLTDKVFSEIEHCFSRLKADGFDQFEEALEILIKCKGKIIFCGLGKTGHLANYAAALFSSIGIKCQFLHANEALHGDMGIIDRNNDVFVFVSFSGNGDEHAFLADHIKIPAILISSNKHSIVGKKVNANIEIQMNKTQESSPLQCVPTHSNVLMMYVLNTLAMAYSAFKGINKNDFSINHPGGQIGRDMFMTVASIMRTRNSLPTTSLETTVLDALPTITSGHCGSIMILDDQEELYGIFTDGDLRRAIDQPDNLQKPLKTFCHQSFHTCYQDTLVSDALEKMQQCKITALIVLDSNENWAGLIHIHDILRSMKCSEESY